MGNDVVNDDSSLLKVNVDVWNEAMHYGRSAWRYEDRDCASVGGMDRTG